MQKQGPWRAAGRLSGHSLDGWNSLLNQTDGRDIIGFRHLQATASYFRAGARATIAAGFGKMVGGQEVSAGGRQVVRKAATPLRHWLNYTDVLMLIRFSTVRRAGPNCAADCRGIRCRSGRRSCVGRKIHMGFGRWIWDFAKGVRCCILGGTEGCALAPPVPFFTTGLCARYLRGG